MKRFISIITVVLLLLAFGLAGCTKDKPDDSSSTSGQVTEQGKDPSALTATQPRSTQPPETQAPSTEPPASTPEAPPPPAHTGKKMVAITFDDGPGPYTRELIEGLNQRGAKATFFMLGQQAEKYGETIKFMQESGHQLGSHTYDHKDITKLSDAEFLEQLKRTDDAIQAACGQIATAFRPPYGAYNQEKLNAQDKTPSHWSVDTQDWKIKNTEGVKQHILTHTKDGSIVLLHDIYKTSVDGALAAIDALKNEGYEFVTVNELVVRNGDPITPHEIYFSCVPRNVG